MNTTIEPVDIFLELSKMYSNSDVKKKEKENTFHIGDTDDTYSVNVCSALPNFSPSEAAAPLADRREKTGQSLVESCVPANNNGVVRHVSVNDIYTDILIQLGEPKGSASAIRTTAYISLMPDDTNRYEIKLSCNLTTVTSETLRMAKAKNNNNLVDIINGYRERYPGVMLGRCRYTPVRGSWSAEFKSILSSALLAVWMNEAGDMCAEFYLLGEFFPMTPEELTDGQTKYYRNQFGYHSDPEEID